MPSCSLPLGRNGVLLPIKHSACWREYWEWEAESATSWLRGKVKRRFNKALERRQTDSWTLVEQKCCAVECVCSHARLEHLCFIFLPFFLLNLQRGPQSSKCYTCPQHMVKYCRVLQVHERNDAWKSLWEKWNVSGKNWEASFLEGSLEGLVCEHHHFLAGLAQPK